ARRPAAADAEGGRPGEAVGERVVADVGGVAGLQPARPAGVAEGLELLVAAEAEGDRGAAADRVGDVHPFGVGAGEEGAEVEVRVAALDPLQRGADRLAAGDEGAEGGGAAAVGGDELEEVRPDAAAPPAGPGVDAMPGGEDELAG